MHYLHIVSFFDFKCIYVLCSSSVDKKIQNVRIIHGRKLRKLGIDTEQGVNLDKVIFNFSNKILSKAEKEVLGLGLEFGLKPDKVNAISFFRNFENLCHRIKDCHIHDNFRVDNILNRISVIAQNSYRNFSSFVNNNKMYNSERIGILKKLKENDELVITRPDKGRGVVILNKDDYNAKVDNILSDSSKFKLIKTELATQILKLEDKLNRLLRKVKDSMGANVYNKLFASGSRPGKLYGLPKIHKDNIPVRPIISSIGTFNYNLAKFLANLIQI